jgi:hypothetical protein
VVCNKSQAPNATLIAIESHTRGHIKTYNVVDIVLKNIGEIKTIYLKISLQV